MKLLLLPILIFSSFSSYSTVYKVHQIEEGDTLSDLLKQESSSVLYGKDKLVDKGLEINRLDKKTARKLKVGSFIILPSSKVVQSSDNTLSSSFKNLDTDLLSEKKVKQQGVEVSIKFSTKQINLKGGKRVTLGENYQIGLSIIGKGSGSPTVSGKISNSNSISFADNSNRLVQFKPGYDLSSTYNVYEQNHIKIGGLLSFNEESNIDYEEEQFKVRRDRYLWLGPIFNKVLIYKKLKVKLSGEIKQKVATQSISRSTNLKLTRSEISAQVHLTKNSFISTLYNTELGDRTYQSLGLSFTYKL
jgi:hypothetical protein